MITLCEKCFPRWGEVEVLTIVAGMPCEGCGERDGRRHVFRQDERKFKRITLARDEYPPRQFSVDKDCKSLVIPKPYTGRAFAGAFVVPWTVFSEVEYRWHGKTAADGTEVWE